MAEARIQIPQELFAPAESSLFEGECILPVLMSGPDVYTIAKPLAWSVTVSNTGDGLLLAGTVEAHVEIMCARCLESFSFPLFGEVEGYYLISDDGATPKDFEEGEFEILPENNEIDLEPLLRVALLLELPFIPLCDENCKGICPHCGCSLNEEECDCAAKHSEDEELLRIRSVFLRIFEQNRIPDTLFIFVCNRK